MVHQERVTHMERLAGDVWRMVLEAPWLAASAKPGQFLNFKCGEAWDAYLRRPISICDVHPEDSSVDIVFQVKGAGTERLSRIKPDDMADFMGPLGSSFQPVPAGGSVVAVGGGIGTFPLLYLLHSMPDVNRTALLGFRTREAVVLEAAFAAQCDTLRIATDDGTYGTHGFVTSLLEEQLRMARPDCVYVCGPTPMMKAVTEMCLSQDVRVQVSMEQRMGCGVGACLVCACKKKTEAGEVYTHVCKEGPVFDGRDIVFDEGRASDAQEKTCR